MFLAMREDTVDPWDGGVDEDRGTDRDGRKERTSPESRYPPPTPRTLEGLPLQSGVQAILGTLRPRVSGLSRKGGEERRRTKEKE